MAKTLKVKLSQLKTTFFVRTQLNQDHVMKLADLYAAGEKLPAIKVTSNWEIIDGRHRVDAAELAFNKDYEIDAEIVTSKSPLDLIAMALEANEGCGLPNRPQDDVYTIQLMLSRGAKEKDIFEKLSFLPRGAVRKYMDRAKVNIRKHNLQQAREAVASGDSVQEAAGRYGIEVRDLKAAIAGPGITSKSSGMNNMLAGITSRYFKLQRANQALVKRLVVGFSDGDVNEKVVEEVLHHIERRIAVETKHVRDWRNRFEAAKKGRMVSWKEIALPSGDIGEDEEEAVA